MSGSAETHTPRIVTRAGVLGSGLVCAFALGACTSKEPGLTGPLTPTHRARLVGTAVASSGVPLDSVRVTAKPLGDRVGSLVVSSDLTSNDGVFDLEFAEYASRAASGQADSVLVVITAQVLQRALFDSSGVRGVEKDTVLVIMTPSTSPVGLGSLTIRLQVPNVVRGPSPPRSVLAEIHRCGPGRPRRRTRGAPPLRCHSGSGPARGSA